MKDRDLMVYLMKENIKLREKASGDGRNLRLLVPGISGTEKTK